MSTMQASTNRPFRRRWADFWFAPGDPTTLGFMRVVTGLLIIYLHLAYCLDLQAFFGKVGWYGTAYSERERKEYPWHVTSLTSWDESGDEAAHVPEAPHRRVAVMKFIRSLPGPTAARQRVLAYLTEVNKDDAANAMGALTALKNLYDAPADKRETLLTALAEGRQLYRLPEGVYLDTPHQNRDTAPVFPAFMLALPQDKRQVAANDLRALIAALPSAAQDANYVLAHLIEMNPVQRKAFVDYLTSLPEDAAERAQLVEYMEYWNDDPRKATRLGHDTFSVWFHVTNPTQMALIHGLSLFVMVLFTVGFCTRVTSVLTWIAVVGYIHRTDQILFGMDTMMNILLIYLVIGNSGAAMSVDRLIARYRAVRASLRRTGTVDAATRAFLAQAPPSAGANFGVRLIQVHFCFIYLASGLAKLFGRAWWDGTAFWDVMINPEFTMMRYPWFEQAVRAVVANDLFGKPLYFVGTALGVWFTWGLEISFPFLVWTRVRPVMLWLAVLLHAGIGVLMGLNLFEMFMMTMLLVFFPPGVIRDRFRGGPDLPRLGYGFDPAEPAQARAAALVAAVDVDGQVTPAPAKGREAVAVTTPAGAAVQGAEGVSALFANLRLLRPLRFLLVVPGAGVLARWLCPFPRREVNVPRSGPPAPAAAS
jgi:hypothetical protein